MVLERSTGPSTATTTTTVVTGTTTTTVASQNLVAVPNVVGMDEAKVKAAMTTADLYYNTTGPGVGPNPTWTKVVSENPVDRESIVKKSSRR